MDNRLKRISAMVACCVFLSGAAMAETTSGPATISLQHSDEEGKLKASIDGRQLFVYNYGESIDLPHFFPLNTPSGKNLLVQETKPYPHHRAFWVSDTVERDGVRGDIYNAYYSGVKTGNKTHVAPFNTGVRHVSFELTTSPAGMATIEESLVWETSRTQTAYPLLDEHRVIKLHALDGGDYLVDFAFTLTANYGDVKFVSDAVHYSWPYLRINSDFSGEGGGTITSDNGATGQEATNLKPALWIDYSNTVDGEAEGVTIFQWPDGEPRKWLTREYGTFGPRRHDARSGKPFTLKKGESLSQRVGIFVHAGDAQTGGVAEMYDRYINGAVK